MYPGTSAHHSSYYYTKQQHKHGARNRQSCTSPRAHAYPHAYADDPLPRISGPALGPSLLECTMPIKYPVQFSSPQGHRKITRKLFTRLKHTQADDVPLPNPSVLEIKFYLKTNRRCRTVFVKNDIAPSHNPPIVSLERAPRFITSQLEAQRIADKHRQSVQLATVLVVLFKYFVDDPIQTASVPTLFFWHDAGRRRTFYLFAYLNYPMEARTYSAAELLGLRCAQAPDTSHSVLARLKADPEFGA